MWAACVYIFVCFKAHKTHWEGTTRKAGRKKNDVCVCVFYRIGSELELETSWKKCGVEDMNMLGNIKLIKLDVFYQVDVDIYKFATNPKPNPNRNPISMYLNHSLTKTP